MASVEDGMEKGEISMEMKDHDGSCCSSTHMANLLRKIAAEIFATYILIFGGCGSVVVNKIYGNVTFHGICISWGIAVMIMIYYVGPISGAHLNPAVTLTLAIFGRFPWKEVPAYIISQLVGSTLASATLVVLFDPKRSHFFGTVPAGTDVQSFVLEMIISLLLMFVVSGAATDARAMGELGAPLAIGSTIVLNVFVAGLISGASMNPARTLGPAFVFCNFKGLWVYIFGPIIGMFLGALAFNFMTITNKPPMEEIIKVCSLVKNAFRGRATRD